MDNQETPLAPATRTESINLPFCSMLEVSSSFYHLHFYILAFSVQSLAPLTGCSDLPGLQCSAQVLKHPLHPPVRCGVFRAHLSVMQRSMVSPFARLGSAHSSIFPFFHYCLNTWGLSA